MKRLIILLFLTPVILYGNIIIVDKNGTGDYTTIQEGIDIAIAGDTVLVLPGSYVETIDFIGKDIVVASLFLTTQDPSYISQTIIDGNQENYQLVKFANGETEQARLVGFTITNASGPSKFSDDDVGTGLGIYIMDSSPSVESNYIIDNHFNEWYYNGGGIVIENSSAKIIGNTISNNGMAFWGGGIYINNASDVVIEKNTISNHALNPGYGASYGSGIYIHASQNIVIQDNYIHDNQIWSFGYGGGIYMLGCDSISIVNNIISDNAGTVGGGIYAAGTNFSIIGNLLYGNHAEALGGGMYCGHCDVLLTNNTICNNDATTLPTYGKGGGLAFSNSSPTIYNTILFSNSAIESGNQVYLDANADPDFFYSNIEGGVAAFGLNDTVVYDGLYENNIDINPQFISSGDHPYALDFNSPCMNAGNPDTTGLLIPDVDLLGNNRIVQGTIDIGAYENQSHVYVPKINASVIISVFPNPTSGKITIRIPEISIQQVVLTIINLQGHEAFRSPIENPVNTYDLSFLSKGIYLLTISGGEYVLTEKIILY